MSNPIASERPLSPDAPPQQCICGCSEFKRLPFKAEDIYRCQSCNQDWYNRAKETP